MSTDRSLHSSDDVEPEDRAKQNRHDLVIVTEFLPGKEPTDYGVTLTEGPPHEYETKYWRCRNCGQERNRRSEFEEACEKAVPSNPVSDGGYTIEDPRTRRALCEEMDVRFGDQGSVYTVFSESGNTYEVDIDAKTCTCPDHRNREIECKHLRRVQLEVLAGLIPAPSGKFLR